MINKLILYQLFTRLYYCLIEKAVIQLLQVSVSLFLQWPFAAAGGFWMRPPGGEAVCRAAGVPFVKEALRRGPAANPTVNSGSVQF